MEKIFFVATILIFIVPALSNGEILKCEGCIVNSTNDFDKRITYYIDIVIPADNAEEYLFTLADKNSGKFKSFLQHNPIVRKTFIDVSSSLYKDKGGKRQQSERYEYIITKMPDNNNSLVGFVYGYEPWILKIDTWKKNKPFLFFKTGCDDLIQGECK